MAVITTTSGSEFVLVKNKTAGAVDATEQFIIAVPQWAKYAQVIFNLTAITGTSTALSLQAYDPVSMDSLEFMALSEMTAPTAQTAQSMLIIDIGPGITGIADDVTNSGTADSYIKVNAIVPRVFGLLLTHTVLTSRTYTLSVCFRGK